jgi:AraC-like DNA-binding protein
MISAVLKPPHYVVGQISPEQFIAEHTFLYVIKGIMRCYDGSKIYVFRSGDCGLGRRNRLSRYKKEKEDGELEKVFVFFDEQFLKKFQEKHKKKITNFTSKDTIVRINPDERIAIFIRSLLPYYKRGGKIDSEFADIKREELLMILLQSRPELSGIFFDYGIPAKINLEKFMNLNYKFNVSIGRFAYLTGRSLSSFKRDFKDIFNETPARWLVQRRLQEAHFLIHKKGRKPADIYLDLGFETLSHFSYAFKKQFRITPTQLTGRTRK